MTFVTAHQRKPLPFPKPEDGAPALEAYTARKVEGDELPPIAPPYASGLYHFDPAFRPPEPTPQLRVYTLEEIEDFEAFAAAVRKSLFPCY